VKKSAEKTADPAKGKDIGNKKDYSILISYFVDTYLV
jgi:hypothetical protein